MRHAAAAIGASVVVLAIALLVLMGRDELGIRTQLTGSLPFPSPSFPIPGTPPPPLFPDEPRAEAWSAADSPALVAERYRLAKDKRAFYDKAREIGGGAHLHFAEKALAACHMAIQLDPVALEQTLLSRVPQGDPNYHRRLAAFRESLESCNGFKAMKGWEGQFRELYRTKGNFADPLSQAARLVRSTTPVVAAPGAIEARRSGARDLLDGGDPYVMLELWPIAKRVSKLPSLHEHMAMTLASWELGVDPGDSLGDCAWDGLCDPMSPDERGLHGWDAKEKEALLARKREIVEAARRKDWAALGF